jgi:hypothetical protein
MVFAMSMRGSSPIEIYIYCKSWIAPESLEGFEGPGVGPGLPASVIGWQNILHRMSLHYRMFDLARAERRGQLIQRGKRYNLNLRYYREIAGVRWNLLISQGLPSPYYAEYRSSTTANNLKSIQQRNTSHYHEIDTWLLSLISHTYVSFRVLAYKGLSLIGTSKYTGFNLNANTNLFHCFGRPFYWSIHWQARGHTLHSYDQFSLKWGYTPTQSGVRLQAMHFSWVP